MQPQARRTTAVTISSAAAARTARWRGHERASQLLQRATAPRRSWSPHWRVRPTSGVPHSSQGASRRIPHRCGQESYESSVWCHQTCPICNIGRRIAHRGWRTSCVKLALPLSQRRRPARPFFLIGFGIHLSAPFPLVTLHGRLGTLEDQGSQGARLEACHCQNAQQTAAFVQASASKELAPVA